LKEGLSSQGLAADQPSGGEKNCLVYSLFCLFIIIITIISSIIIISFVALLNCLYISPRIFPFVHFSTPSHCVEGEWWV